MVSDAGDFRQAEASSHLEDDGPGSDRTFGLVFAAAFAAIAILPTVHHGRIRIWAIAVAAVFLCVALLKPSVLRPLNIVWFRFGMLLGKVVTPVMMGLIFLLAMTPVAILRRSLKSSGLDIRFDSRATSYWIPRQQTSRSFKQQF